MLSMFPMIPHQLDLFEEEAEEPLTLKQAIKNDPWTLFIISVVTCVFIFNLF